MFWPVCGDRTLRLYFHNCVSYCATAMVFISLILSIGLATCSGWVKTQGIQHLGLLEMLVEWIYHKSVMRPAVDTVGQVFANHIGHQCHIFAAEYCQNSMWPTAWFRVPILPSRCNGKLGWLCHQLTWGLSNALVGSCLKAHWPVGCQASQTLKRINARWCDWEFLSIHSYDKYKICNWKQVQPF